MGKADSTAGRDLIKTRNYTELLRLLTRPARAGYTLVEMMVVLAVMGLVAGLTIYALRSFNSTEPLSNAQKEFVVNLRSAQTRAESGDTINNTSVVQQVTFSSGGYAINGSSISLPAGVSISTLPANIVLCFPNPNLDAYDNAGGHKCGNCISGVGFVCKSGTTLTSEPVKVTFTKTGASPKIVNISGSGMQIIEIDAQ